MTVNNTKTKLNWNASGDERRAQNAANLLHVGYYENAFERTMGNKSMDVAQSESGEISEEVHRNFANFMPSVEVIDVRASTDHKGDTVQEVDIAYE